MSVKEIGKLKGKRGAHKNAKSKARGLNRRKEAREAAEARNEKWAKLSTKEKLASLDKRPGKSKKQRIKLFAAQSNKELAA